MSGQLYTYEYPRAAITTDSVVFGYEDKKLYILLIERKHPPYQGQWALPGGFLDLNLNETLEECARRELMEETNADVYMEQFHAFSAPDRDPRGRVITVAFWAVVNKGLCHIKACDDAQNTEWFELNKLPPLAFDHQEIIAKARRRLQEKLRIESLASRLFPELDAVAYQAYLDRGERKYPSDF